MWGARANLCLVFLTSLPWAEAFLSAPSSVLPRNAFAARGLPRQSPARLAHPGRNLGLRMMDLGDVGSMFGTEKKGSVSEAPILQFYGDRQKSSLDKFERFDDQIMGGISQSAMLSNGEGEDASAMFAGVVRVEGGGFCGARMKLLSEPLDLNGYTGMYLKVRGDGKTYKINCRTNRNSGETVYQAEFTPPVLTEQSFSTIRIPFGAFRLVKRAVPVPNPVPLPSGSVFQLGLVLSKFSFGEDEFNKKFQAGPFRMEISEIGAYKDPQQHTSWEDSTPCEREGAIDIKDENVIVDSLAYKPSGEKRGWWSRFLIKRVRKLLKKRVSQRRTDVAKDLLAKRKEGKRLSEIRQESWTAPAEKVK